MGLFKSIGKIFKKAAKSVVTLKFARTAAKPLTKLFKQAIGGLFAGPKIPGFPDLPSPASAPTFAQAGGPASRGGISRANIGLSLISSGGASGLAKRAKTKKRSLIGGA